MHLPPLDVAVYPVVTMSRGARSTRPSPSTSSPSSSCSSRSTTSTVQRQSSPDFSSIQAVIRNVFRSTRIKVQQIERLQGRLHQVYLARLADGSSLVLKCPPASNTRLLRHERTGLETESKTLETLREYTQVPVPQIIKYTANETAVGSSFLMMSHMPGKKLSEMIQYLTASERRTIDRALGSYVRSLTALSATQFGLTTRVFAKRGHSSWREAFMSLLESALRDAEDMLVTIPYDSIRYYVGRHSQLLDEIREPRLAALNVCDPENVFVDERTKQVTALVGFTNVIWGDPLMSGGIAEGSEAFLEGYGERPTQNGGAKARQLMYATYRAVTQIVAHHYRPHIVPNEDEARRTLAYALNDLAQM